MLLQKTFNVLSFSWAEVAPLVRSIIPPLLHSEHKGSMGRIGVIGGSRDYTGAPFYAADASLKFGADLSFVFASKEACGPIKAYSPELMVSPFYRDDFFDYQLLSTSDAYEQQVQDEITHAKTVLEAVLPRLHTLVIGPGLGRNTHVLDVVQQVVRLAMEKNIQLVLDADAIMLFDKYPLLLQGYSRCIVTPNAAEFNRLVTFLTSSIPSTCSTSSEVSENDNLKVELSSSDVSRQVRAASILLGGVTILRKGETDVVSNGEDVYVLQDKGSPRRCGGQGDILAGSIATAFTWAVRKKLEEAPSSAELLQAVRMSSNGGSVSAVQTAVPGVGEEESRLRRAAIVSVILATSVVKRASLLGFQQYGRSMTAPNVLEKLGEAFQHCE